ncbi:MAG TPA: MFS transporter [Candidatus Limnocylindrales bacterium]|nr:MFS transporter [Candidatus Limnocylindrales bacterium]
MGTSSVWRNRDFVRLWAASTVSVFGSLITRTALPFAAILVLGAGPLEIAAIRSFEIVGGLVVSLAAGAWVDRLRRRPVMIVADLGRALLLASIPAAALVASLSIAQLIVVGFLTAILTTFHNVADSAYLPTVVERDQLVASNAALTASGSVAEFSAFSIGGFLVQLLTAPIAIAVDAVSFLASALFIGSIRRPEPDRPGVLERRPILAEILEGLRPISRSPILTAIAGASSGSHFLWGVFGSVYLVFATEELGLGPATIGVIAAVGGACSFVGAVLAERVSRRVGIGPAILLGVVGFTLGNALTPLAPAGAIAIAVALLVAQQLIADGAGTIGEINEISLVQTVAPDRVLGRVNGSIEFLTHLWLLVGTIAGGLIGEALGLRAAMVVGLLGGVAAIVFLWLSPIRSLRAEASAPPPHPLMPGDDTPLTE